MVNKAIYLAFGVKLQGLKEVLGMWAAESEGAKFWMQVITELKNRGVQDIFIACVDNQFAILFRRSSPDGRTQPKLTYTDCLELPAATSSSGATAERLLRKWRPQAKNFRLFGSGAGLPLQSCRSSAGQSGRRSGAPSAAT